MERGRGKKRKRGNKKKKPFFTSSPEMLTPSTMKAIRRMEFDHATPVQEAVLVRLMSGADVIATASSGSGKTLACLIHYLEIAYRLLHPYSPLIGAIIICPTVEVAEKTYDVATRFLGYCNRTSLALATGGLNTTAEAQVLIGGPNLLVTTPDGLRDHLRQTQLIIQNLKALMIDEADWILNQANLYKAMMEIIEFLPKERQTAFFTTDLSKQVEQFARLACHKTPFYISLADGSKMVNYEDPLQGYCVVPSENRFILLYSFLERNKTKKVLVFFSSTSSVKFHSKLLESFHVECSHIQRPEQSESILFRFWREPQGILLLTDDECNYPLPSVDFVLQYDPPNEPKDYSLRVALAADDKYARGKINAMLFLIPQELLILHHLRAKQIYIVECDFYEKRLRDVQAIVETTVAHDNKLNKLAEDAYRSYIEAYRSYSLKDVFKLDRLDCKAVAASFGLPSPPPSVIRSHNLL